jgi:hypothetical protein
MSVNFWPRPATAASLLAFPNQAGGHPRAGPHPGVDLQPIAVTPEPGSSSPAVPSSCPEHSVGSGHQRATASATAPLSCITSPRWATRGYVPSPRCPPGWSRLGHHQPGLPPTTRARRRSGQSRRRLIARVGVTDSVGVCRQHARAAGPVLAPMPRSSPTRVWWTSCQGILLSTKASLQWWRGRP